MLNSAETKIYPAHHAVNIKMALAEYILQGVVLSIYLDYFNINEQFKFQAQLN